MVFGFKVAQLFATFGAQVAIVVIVGHYDSMFGIIAILNFGFSLLTLFMRGWDMVVKRGILRNSAKSDDCEAARRALSIDRASTPSATSDVNLELGPTPNFTENPLFQGQSVVPNNHRDAGDSDSLLISMQATILQQAQRVDQQEQRLQEQEAAMNQMKEAFEALTRPNHQRDEPQCST